ncbi:hypothetical protein [Burkholderia cenocepacia]|nr:hypothetical protein [Burkholderia cenocepacia]
MSEREKFEAWAVDHIYPIHRQYARRSRVTAVMTDRYADARTATAWHAWQGKAQSVELDRLRELANV